MISILRLLDKNIKGQARLSEDLLLLKKVFDDILGENIIPRWIRAVSRVVDTEIIGLVRIRIKIGEVVFMLNFSHVGSLNFLPNKTAPIKTSEPGMLLNELRSPRKDAKTLVCFIL